MSRPPSEAHAVHILSHHEDNVKSMHNKMKNIVVTLQKKSPNIFVIEKIHPPAFQRIFLQEYIQDSTSKIQRY